MSEQTADRNAMRQLCWALGAAGLLPFVGNALFAWVVPLHEADGVLRSQAHYAASILTFLGALHWGLQLGLAGPFMPRDGLRLVWSVLPSIYAWVVTLYSIRLSLPLLCCALPLALVVDWLLYRGTPVPRWFLVLRTVLTLVATACVAASWLAMSVRLRG